ncbi:TonB-dependent siderophore receptor [Marinomonas rhizomae]|uniref:Iron complex outermembrane receptor protein n=1 Tax=Marinomonas rhizomae TaxID=491948 RepID=A0A366JFR1_9GAMM|nr:TonB-dependent siderophore receptor [Marinomonas rhizomae]RBP85145.1 iron complex outermembrane receptor protein [Marinomonas rhizomae]RNF76250.1 TonB-dependent siderophore receptor [Marinomonas rhizomae]
MKPALHIQPTLLALAIASATSYSIAETGTDENNLNNTDQLTTLEVKGQSYRNTATKTQLDPEETPQAISIIDSKELETRGVESLNEAVRYTAGVHSELRGGAITRLDLFNIRGFDNTLVYYDGLPLLYNGNNLQAQIDAAAVDQVEVFKGPASTLYGSMPPGGMINMISKAPQKEKKNSVKVTIGSDNKKEASFDSTGAISEDVNYRLIGLVRDKDGQANTTTEERVMIAPSLDIKLSEDTLLNLNMYYQKDPSMGTFGALPGVGTVYDNAYGKVDSDTFLGDENFNTFEREFLMFGYKIDHKINDTWQFLQNSRFTTAKSYQEMVYSTGLESDKRTVKRAAYITDEESKSISIDNQFSGAFDIGNVEHNVLLGVDYLKTKSNFQYQNATAVPTIDLYEPDNNQFTASDLTFVKLSDHDYNSSQLGLYLQDQMRFDQLVLIAGGRYDQYKYDESGINYGSAATKDIDQTHLSGRLGALYELQNGLSPFISYSQSFEPVMDTRNTGKDYEPTTSAQWETGLKYNANGFHGSLAVYEITKNDILTNDPDDPSDQRKIQVGEIRSRGIELEVNKAITEEVSLSLAANLQDVEITKDNSGLEGNTPIRIPEKQLSVWLSYKPAAGKLVGTTLGAGARYVGEMQIDAANSDTLSPYTLVDLSIGYDLAQLSSNWKGASIQFSVSNLLDETYFSCYSKTNCWYGADRSFELTGRYDF